MRWPLVIGVALVAAANVALAQTSRPASEASHAQGYLISYGSGDGRAATAPAPTALIAVPSSSLPSVAPPPPVPQPVVPRTPNNVLPTQPLWTAPPVALAPPAANVLVPAPANAPAPALTASAAEPVNSVATPAPQMFGAFLASSAGLLQRVDPNLRVPLFVRGPVAIGQNESARPQDRVFVTFDYFNNAIAYQSGAGRNFNVYRETLGFEKTFMGGDASVGLRAPILQKDNLNFDADGFGDITLLSKFTILHNHDTGDVLSGGLTVTLPTGSDVILSTNGGTSSEHFDVVLLQPWLGFVVNSDRFYVHGFTSVIFSTDERDVTLLTADLGVGYKIPFAAGDGLITQVIPTLEFHGYVPLNHTGVDSGGQLVQPYQYALTGGAHVALGCRALLSVGVAMPLTGPNPYDFGLLCQFNLRF